ncbi:metallophosphoesterase family protein [Roseibacillus ishigakijimensis]|uniref:Serine/threonine protein phosphatase n=1 Tax=Roseibacillus ishigakijimensis TaxID=454146 RepID=A0A934VG65_9BACT|nr:metallophosphoesterase family protein [Roseibacillus ishigakijimensis]MBK1832518.1 serine/threonine protein phosphatase [Roseibacillus ishigakijimensis]
MRTLAISDIHGCLAPLQQLWDVLAPKPEDHVIFLGDYVDRGPDSKGVIDFLIEKSRSHRIDCLCGNHEEKFVLSRIDKTDHAHWVAVWGGQETLDSYGPRGMEDVPDSHWQFLLRNKPFVETESHIFVHAYLEAEVPVSEQLPYILLHQKFNHPLYGPPKPHFSGKIMICGHTAQKSHLPLNLGHAVCIDTDPGRGGWLTGLHVETGHYFQTNVDGQVREGDL